jgi:hypothetical protein
VKQAVRITKVTLKILSHKAIRTSNGVPIDPTYVNNSFSFDVGPFIFSFTQEDLVSYNERLESLQSLQDGFFAKFLKYSSVHLLVFNFIQPIASLILVETVLPTSVYYLIC